MEGFVRGSDGTKSADPRFGTTGRLPYRASFLRSHRGSHLAGKSLTKLRRVHHNAIYAILHGRVRIGLREQSQHLGRVVFAPALPIAYEEALLRTESINGLWLPIQAGSMGEVCSPCEFESSNVSDVFPKCEFSIYMYVVGRDEIVVFIDYAARTLFELLGILRRPPIFEVPLGV